MTVLRVAFVVQGEGRGHLTQALALARFLGDAGHEVVRVLVGTSPHRSLPAYFAAEMPAPVTTFHAPTQVPDADRRGVSVGRTALDALTRMPRFVASGVEIHRATEDADVVVNLLDLVGGASRAIFRSRVPAVAMAHNHLFGHPELSGAPGGAQARRMLRAYADATAARTVTRVALSFVPMSGSDPSRLVVAPPLLRAGLDGLDRRDGEYLLAYALNAGYGSVLADWQAGRDDVTVHCYLEGGAEALPSPPPGFHVHALDQTRFLEHLAGCRAYVGSAGFESLCEAFYLGKPVLAVPTEGQLEQRLNAWDAERCGVARAGAWNDLDSFWVNLPKPPESSVADFRDWVRTAPQRHVEIVERAAAGARAGRAGS